MRCLTCHYSLANLTEHRCPECGREFDPNDPSTFAERRKPSRVLIILLITVSVVLIAEVVAIVCMVVFAPDSGGL